MRIQINPSDPLPIYRQIMNQVVDAIAGGQLSEGSQLPSHRELAQTLVVAPLTIKKAYDELERTGYLRMKRGQGSFITGGPSMTNKQRLERLQPAVQALVRDASLLAIAPEALHALVASELRAADKNNASRTDAKKKS